MDSLSPVDDHTQADCNLAVTTKVKGKFSLIWKEFLLINVEPTQAATNTFRYIAGSSEEKDRLEASQAELRRIENDFIQPVLDADGDNEIDLYPLIQREIGGFFSNYYVLNNVFSLRETEVSNLSSAFDSDNAINFLDRICRVLELSISDTSLDETFINLSNSLKNLLDNLSSHMSANPQCFVNAVQLRFFLVILGFPFFETFAYEFEKILDQLYDLFSRLPIDCSKIISTWFSELKTVALRRYLIIAQQRITLLLLSASSEGGLIALRDSGAASLKNAIVFIKALYEANLYRKRYFTSSLDFDVLKCQFEDSHTTTREDELLVPLELCEFYNDAINAADKLLQWDFVQWSKEEPSDFNLVENSFLLDVASKNWYLYMNTLMHQNLSSRELWFQISGLQIDQPSFLVLHVRRSELVYDALRKLTNTVAPRALKKPLRIIFADEDAVDEGGVTKEFFQLLVEQLFNPDYGMFTYNETTHLFWFCSYTFEHNLQFELIGMVLGLAIYNGVILDIHLPLSVYKKLLDIPVGLKDLEEIDPELGLSLYRLLSMNEDDLVEANLTFSVDIKPFDEVQSIQISPKYEMETPVTIHNRKDFIEAYIDFVLNRSISAQFNAFYRGFMRCCGEEIKKLGIQPDELLLIICGSNDFDFETLESVTQYRDGYTSNDRTICDFWEIVHSYTDEDKRKLLFFVTGSDRIPVKGLSSLQFFIGRPGSDVDRVPSAHTCFNYLLLPDYKDKEKLDRYLRIAITHHKGFGLR